MNAASSAAASPRVALFTAGTPGELLEELARGRERAVGGPARAVVVDPTPERVERARAIVTRGKPWRAREEIWFTPRGLLWDGTLAFLFPGVDAVFEPRVEDVASHFGLPVPPCLRPRDLTEHGIAIVGVNRLLDQVLRDLGFAPAHVAGHSVGEWSGLVSTGMLSAQAVDHFVASLRPGAIEVPGVVFAAAGCGVEAAAPALDGLPDVHLTHDNCPHQILFCGPEAPVDEALSRLRARGVLCQKLPFQSGFHSPLFTPYLAPHRENFRALPLQPPRVPLWSATTCEPYPRGPDAVRALSIEHLVRPVRFRELVTRLHDEGVRVFVQAGTGSLVNFVEDTLRGRPHLAVASNVKERSGLSQLRRVLAALFVEGAHASSALLGSARSGPLVAAASPPASVARPSHPLALELDGLLAAVEGAGRDVLAAFRRSETGAPRERVVVERMSLETMPELRDHAFVRQPAGWPNPSDGQPVVPMTMLLDLVVEHARAMTGADVALAVEELRAYRWLIVSPPVDVEITCRSEGADRVHVRVGDYAEARVVLGGGYPSPPEAPTVAPSAPRTTGVEGRDIYARRLLFHGPAYQGLARVDTVGDDGARGTLEVTPGRGALLDSAGQLYGYWVMDRHEVDRMAMPVHVARARFYGPHPGVGERLECDVRVRAADARAVVADVTLSQGGKVWASLEGWEDRRFETDSRLWDVMLWPEKRCLSTLQPEGFVVFEDTYRAAPTRDRLSRRYLGEDERQQFARQGPRVQRGWLAGRIAAKDAVRELLWALGLGPIFPVEVTIATEPTGRPRASAPGGRDVRVSIAHKDGIAVALARDGLDAGIDVERVAQRDASFARAALSPGETRLVDGEPPDVGWTRLWCAKEAAAKAEGTGLSGAPHRFPVRDRVGTRLLVGERWVDTKRHGDFVIGWTAT